MDYVDFFVLSVVVAGFAAAVYYANKARKGRPRGGYGGGNDKGGDLRPK
jgi:hypothetical protein